MNTTELTSISEDELFFDVHQNNSLTSNKNTLKTTQLQSSMYKGIECVALSALTANEMNGLPKFPLGAKIPYIVPSRISQQIREMETHFR